MAFAWPDGASAAPTQRRASARPQSDFFHTTLLSELDKTHRFLLGQRHGQPYAGDSRALEPFSEVIRLQADAQVLGYLNLFELTRRRPYLREAEERLDYLLALGDSALAGQPLDGQIGYSFLRAYECTGRPDYREAGLRIAERCLDYEARLVMNWGYAAALCLGKAHRITGDERFRRAARLATRRTGSRQFADGCFPHREFQSLGENSPYTIWLLFEMLLHRRDDREDPDMDAEII